MQSELSVGNDLERISDRWNNEAGIFQHAVWQQKCERLCGMIISFHYKTGSNLKLPDSMAIDSTLDDNSTLTKICFRLEPPGVSASSLA